MAGVALATVAAAVGVCGVAHAAPGDIPCNPNGPTQADQRIAAHLSGTLTATLRGQLTGERVACARIVVRTTKARGLGERAAVIAITTTIVESKIINHGVATDHDSYGLFQQRPSQGWGTRESREGLLCVDSTPWA